MSRWPAGRRANPAAARRAILRELQPFAERAYAEVARGEAPLALRYLAAGSDLQPLADGQPIETEKELAARMLAALRVEAWARPVARLHFGGVLTRTTSRSRSARSRRAPLPARVRRGRSCSPSRSANWKISAPSKAARRFFSSTMSPASSIQSAIAS